MPPQVCTPSASEGLKISTASVKLGEPDAFFLVATHRPVWTGPAVGDGHGSTVNPNSMPMPTLKSPGLFSDDPYPPGTKMLTVCNQQGLEAGIYYIGIFTVTHTTTYNG